MSVRKDTKNRKTLIRECGTCSAMFLTTADTPWLRQIARDGKRQATTYFCCYTCFSKSYKHLFDGKADERRKEKERMRSTPERRHEKYMRNRDRELKYQRERYWSDPEKARESNRFQRKKNRLLSQDTG